MKNDNTIINPSMSPSKVCFSRSQDGITNLSAIWRPGIVIPKDVQGLTSATISLDGVNGCWLKAGVLREENGRLTVSLTYNSPDRKAIAVPEFLPESDHVYLEIDVNPRNSRVTFWINDRGLDMGVLPGFQGGAKKASWFANAINGAHLISGKFTDCAFATAAGWVACDLSKSESNHYNLQAHHEVKLLSYDGFSFGDKRSIA